MEKKIFTDESLVTFVDETKSYIDKAVVDKADSDHNHDYVYETKDDAQSKYNEITEAKADWNQNDESAIDYVKNRTHWIENTTSGSEILLDEYNFTMSSSLFGAELPIDIDPYQYENSTVVVTYDSVEYECTMWSNTYNCLSIGDSRLSSHTGDHDVNQVDVPFCIEISYDEMGEVYIWSAYCADSNQHSIKIEARSSATVTVYHPLDDRFIPDNIVRLDDIDIKMNKENPTGTGSFSLNRKENTTIGNRSVSIGYNNEASGHCSYAEGGGTVASNQYSHAEGTMTKASGYASHAEGSETIAAGSYSHAQGITSRAVGAYSHAEGQCTCASGDSSHVQGKYNIIDADYKYSHIVGNGSDNDNRSNAHTLDWDGNAWFKGDVYVGGTSQDNGAKLIKSTGDTMTGTLQVPNINIGGGAILSFDSALNAIKISFV